MADAALPNEAATKLSKDSHARGTTVRLLQALAVAALLLPILFFLFASWRAYRSTQALADERIERSLDVMQEQALKVFQSMNLAIDTIDDLARRQNGNRNSHRRAAIAPAAATDSERAAGSAVHLDLRTDRAPASDDAGNAGI